MLVVDVLELVLVIEELVVEIGASVVGVGGWLVLTGVVEVLEAVAPSSWPPQATNPRHMATTATHTVKIPACRRICRSFMIIRRRIGSDRPGSGVLS